MVFIANVNVNRATPADIPVLKALSSCIYRNSSPDPEHELAEQSLAISIPHTPSSATVICIADFTLIRAHLPCKIHFCLKLRKD